MRYEKFDQNCLIEVNAGPPIYTLNKTFIQCKYLNILIKIIFIFLNINYLVISFTQDEINIFISFQFIIQFFIVSIQHVGQYS